VKNKKEYRIAKTLWIWSDKI